MPSIKKVAEVAGVSVGTVSHVITGSVPVSEPLRLKVQAAIRDLNYHPNFVARSLTRGSSQADPDLDKAAGLLKYPPNVWIFDPTTSWAPTASSQSQYRAARRALLSYNDKLASHQAVFERRADNLLSTLDRFAADIGSSSAVLDQQIRDHSGDFVDFHADDVFYNAKGKLYAYAMLFRALGKDFAKVIEDKDLKSAWEQTATSLLEGATLKPLVVINGRPDGMFLPNHLAVEGFYLLRARTQLREITNILAK